ncbi:protein CURVATURE THYLAKOID 1B, chloroplastic-like [Bidens hawaiensis]|uniref:protein CURVATURE THYLAKOID 1B, chloroplastic-like n=1 Tax=Bidens hawaiensis TaxID=980011 RepID=UPI00404B6085
MATTVHSLSTTSTTLLDAKAPRQSLAAASAQCVSIPSLPAPPLQQQNRVWKATGYCKKLARNVANMATGEATPETALDVQELIKPLQEAWEKVEDKYAVSSLAVAGVVFLWGSTGLISAIDRLPLVPGVLELVGIGYTGWFAYKNLVFKPDREALIEKVKCTYRDIIGSS